MSAPVSLREVSNMNRAIDAKRNQYRVEIRKQTLQDLFNLKRFKLDEPPIDDGPVPVITTKFFDDEPENKAEQAAVTMFFDGRVQKFRDAMGQNDIQSGTKLLFCLRKMLAKGPKPPIHMALNCDLHLMLIHIATCPDYTNYPDLLYEVAWCLTNLTAGDSSTINTLLDNNVLDALGAFLSAKEKRLQELAVWMLGNLAGDGSHVRRWLFQQGVVNWLLEAFGEAKIWPEMANNLTLLISNLVRPKPTPNYEDIRGVLPILANLLRRTNEAEELTEILWTLFAISNIQDDLSDFMLINGHQKIIDCLCHNANSVKYPALSIIGNLLSANVLQLDENLLKNLLNLLDSKDKPIRREVCWALSNIVMCSPGELDVLMKTNLFNRVLRLLLTDDVDIKKEVFIILQNSVKSASGFQVQNFVRTYRLLDKILDFLKGESEEMICHALDLLMTIMSAGDEVKTATSTPNRDEDFNPYVKIIQDLNGQKILEELQYKPSKEVYDKTFTLIDRFFQCDEIEPAN